MSKAGLPTENPPAHVNVSTPEKRKFWCSYFNCSEEELGNAINKIGNCTPEVQIFLQRSGTGKQNHFWAKFLRDLEESM